MNKPNHSKSSPRKLTILAIFLSVSLALLLSWVVGIPLIRFASEPEQFRLWVDSHGMLGRIAFLCMVVFQILLALIPGEPFEIAAGYTFGVIEGTLLCILASGIGSSLVYFLVKRFGIRLAEVFFTREKLESVGFLKTSKKRIYLLLLVFMLPGTPKDLISYFVGLTDIPYPIWLVICSFGRLPSIITSTVGGDALGEERYWFAIGVFAITLAISSLGFWLYQRIQNRSKNNP